MFSYYLHHHLKRQEFARGKCFIIIPMLVCVAIIIIIMFVLFIVLLLLLCIWVHDCDVLLSVYCD